MEREREKKYDEVIRSGLNGRLEKVAGREKERRQW